MSFTSSLTPARLIAASMAALPLAALATPATAQDLRDATDTEGNVADLAVPFAIAADSSRDRFNRRGPTPCGTPLFFSINNDPEGDQPVDVAFLTDGSAVVIPNQDTDNATFVFIDGSPNLTVPVGTTPTSVATTADGNYVVISNGGSGDVTILSQTDGSLVATVAVGGESADRVKVTADSAKAIVAWSNEDDTAGLTVIDLATQTVDRSFASTPLFNDSFSATPEYGISYNVLDEFAINSDGSIAALMDEDNDAVNFYDTTTGNLLASTPIPNNARNIVFSAEDSFVLVLSSAELTKIETTTFTVDNAIPVPSGARAALTEVPNTDFAYIGYLSETRRVNHVTGAIDLPITVFSLGELNVTPDGSRVLATGSRFYAIDPITNTRGPEMAFIQTNDAAISPDGSFGAALNRNRGEEVALLDLDAGSIIDIVKTGNPEEGDNPVAVAISPGGTQAVTGNIASGNLTFLDTNTGTVLGYADTGNRQREVKYTPDGTKLLAAAVDSDQVVVFDPDTRAELGRVTIVRRPSEIQIAPDSSEAYILNIAGSDRITFIDLTGAAPNIAAQLPAGQAGSAGGVYISQIDLSDDGTILVSADSFNDRLKIFDVATRTETFSVPTSDFPLAVTISPDGALVLVGNYFDENIDFIDPAAGNLLTSVPLPSGNRPIDIFFDNDNATAYVRTTAGTLEVIDTAAAIRLGAITPPANIGDVVYDPQQDRLFVTQPDGILEYAAEGVASAVVNTFAGDTGSYDLAYQTGLLASVSATTDGVTLTGIDCCPADFNNSGSLNTLDLIDFINAFRAGDIAADFNNSGNLSTLDLIDFINAFRAGC